MASIYIFKAHFDNSTLTIFKDIAFGRDQHTHYHCKYRLTRDKSDGVVRSVYACTFRTLQVKTTLMV
ncbi:hypothetical protein C5167_023130 [Papaver somniferum]|uniref:Uncharacterized protein n=1 Tax=Papaver somniferum TaxID=3469 RepID=A0A4Y7JJW7_PAPSO|nr:hypothetical protein C5167_023130 [Papaver somniferum]